MDDNLELVNSKIKKYKILRFLDILLASLLTLIGTVLVVYLMMFLNVSLGVGYFNCFILSFILSQFYSDIVNNVILRRNERKINDVLSDIVKINDDNNFSKISEFGSSSKNVQLRFEQLSTKSKLELLSYVKNNIYTDTNCRNEDSYLISTSKCILNSSDVNVSLKKGRSRCKDIREENRNKHL